LPGDGFPVLVIQFIFRPGLPTTFVTIVTKNREYVRRH
jgi:hypothetical protein